MGWFDFFMGFAVLVVCVIAALFAAATADVALDLAQENKRRSARKTLAGAFVAEILSVAVISWIIFKWITL
jgi:hypothetical protein